MNPPLNSVNESLNWMNPPLILVNESLNWMNPPLNSVNESLNWMNPPLNSVNESLNSINEFLILHTNTLGLRIIVGWVVACFPVGVRSETQQSPENVGFRPSTQPT
ncbi:hypothetical protein [Nostoc sp.]|uniref:hypothetical protein n=1 Tax=Nostoc sp. TaxID=1180 RepID=UPI002FF93D0E